MTVTIDLTAEFQIARSQVYKERLGSLEDDNVFVESADPVWMQVANKLRADILLLQQTLTKIEDKERQRQKSIFNDVLASEIKVLAKSATDQIETLQAGIVGLNSQSLSNPAEEELRRGVVGSLFASLRRETQNLRDIHQRYAAALALPETYESAHLTSQASQARNTSVLADQRAGLSSEEIKMRQQEITYITTGIAEIANIITQMSELIYEQGTVLDRIDANVYTAVGYAEEGRDILKHARKRQWKMRWCKKLTYIIIGVDYSLLLVYIFLRLI
ncbi:Syntaxin 16 [Giardia lamblia P15]|uniref:Syntaxin 16 n=1 Tax=Giardia intestinalis (strain P15) TaxID=658858 RepID=E1F2B8_GIAIA|nr:Syntaxin 16 [Giardia lamblia P15]